MLFLCYVCVLVSGVSCSLLDMCVYLAISNSIIAESCRKNGSSVSSNSFLHCFDAVGWVTGRASRILPVKTTASEPLEMVVKWVTYGVKYHVDMKELLACPMIMLRKMMTGDWESRPTWLTQVYLDWCVCIFKVSYYIVYYCSAFNHWNMQNEVEN